MNKDKPQQVLIVEDEPSLLSTLTKKISELGVTVHQATDGKEGLSLFKKHRPDLVLADIIMPNMNGFDLIQKLRTEFGNSFKVMFITNLSDTQDKEMGESLDIDDYILKSDISLRAIQNKVSQVLNKN